MVTNHKGLLPARSGRSPRLDFEVLGLLRNQGRFNRPTALIATKVGYASLSGFGVYIPSQGWKAVQVSGYNGKTREAWLWGNSSVHATNLSAYRLRRNAEAANEHLAHMAAISESGFLGDHVH